jgi:hypothetical protein
MRKDTLAAMLACAAFAVATVGTVSAGEVKGPAGTVNNTNYTGARTHANSDCAYSGLNDLDTADGQNVNQVQTAADSWKLYGLVRGFPGLFGACKGGTNLNREPVGN